MSGSALQAFLNDDVTASAGVQSVIFLPTLENCISRKLVTLNESCSIKNTDILNSY